MLQSASLRESVLQSTPTFGSGGLHMLEALSDSDHSESTVNLT